MVAYKIILLKCLVMPISCLALQKQLLLEHIGEYDILMPLNLSNNDFESYS